MPEHCDRDPCKQILRAVPEHELTTTTIDGDQLTFCSEFCRDEYQRGTNQ